MADVNKTVEIKLLVTGDVVTQLKKVSESFLGVSNKLASFSESVVKLGTALSSIKVSSDLVPALNSLKALHKVELPDITNLAAGLSSLAKVGKMPDLSQTNIELRKLSGISLPGVLQMANGLIKLSDATININQAATNLKGILGPLRALSGLTLPSLPAIANSLKTMVNMPVNPKVIPFVNGFAASMKSLDGVKAPDVSKMVKGMQDLKNFIDPASKISANVDSLGASLRKLGGIEIPGIAKFVRGLQQIEKLNIQNIVQRITDLSAAIKLLEQSGTLKSFSNFAQDLRNLNTQLSQVLPQFQQIQNGFKNVGNAAQSSGQKVKGFGERLTNYIQYRLIADSVMQLEAAFVGGMQVIIDFDQSLKDLQAITGATGAEVSTMGDKIIEVAKNTKFSAAEVAQGMTILGQAGFSASEAVKTIQAVSDLATGTLSGMAESVDLVSTAMSVFDISAENSTHVADVFATAVNKSKLDIEKLRVAFNYVGPVAQDAGVSFEEVAASMSILSNQGLRASTIGTGLRRIFADLTDPSEKLQVAVRNAGLSMTDLDPRASSLSTVMSNLNLVVKDSQQAFDLFGRYGAGPVLALKNSQGEFSEFMDTLGKSGVAAEMAAIQMEGLGVKFKNLKDRVEVLAISLGNAGISAILEGIVTVLKTAVVAVTAFTDSAIGGFVTKAALFVAGASLMYVILGKLVVAYGALTTAYVLNLTAANASLLGVGAMSGAIFSLVGAMRAIPAAVMSAVAAFEAFIVSGGIFGTLVGTFLGPLLAIGAYLIYATASINDFSESSKEATKNAARFEELQGGIKAYSDRVRGLAADSTVLKDATIGLKAELIKASSSNKEIADSAIVAANSIDAYTGKISDNGAAIKAYNDELAKLRMDNVVKAYSDAVSAVESETGALSRVYSYLGTSFTYMGKNFSAAMDGLLNWDYSKFEHSAKAVKRFANEANDSLDFTKALNNGEKTFEEFEAFFAQLKAEGFNNLSDQGKNLYKIFEQLNEKSGELLKYLFETNKINLNGSVEELEKVALEAGATEEQLQAVIAKFEKLKNLKKESDAKSGLEFTKTFQDGGEIAMLKNLAEFRKRNAELEEKYTEDQIKGIEKRIEAMRDLANSHKNIAKEFEENKKDFGEKAAYEIKVKQEEEYNEAVRKLLRESEDDAAFTANKKLSIAKEAMDKELEENQKKNAAYLTSNEQHGKADAEAKIKYAKAVAEALVAVYDTKQLKELLQTNTATLKEAEEKDLLRINLLEADKTKTKEEAERERFEITRKSLQDQLKLAQEHATKMKAAGADDKGISDANQESLKREKEYTEFLQKELLKQVENEEKADEKITELNQKVVDEKKKHSTEVLNDSAKYKRDIVTLEDDLSDKILKINKTLQDKIRELNKKRFDNAKKTKEDIAALESSAEDKIREINQKGMSDDEKETNNIETYRKKLEEGIKLIDDAQRSGNVAMLERGSAMVKSAQDIGSALNDEKLAVEAVKKTTDELTRARKLEGQLAEKEINRDVRLAKETADFNAKMAREDAALKLSKIDEVYLETSKKEDARHEKEMKNLEKELAEWNKKIEIAKGLISDTKNASPGYTPKAVETTDSSGKTTSNTSDSVKKTAEEGTAALKKMAEESAKVQEGVVKGIKDTVTITVNGVQQVMRHVDTRLKGSEDSYREVVVNGKTMLTNLKDEQRNATVEIENGVIKLGEKFNAAFNVQNVKTDGIDNVESKIKGTLELAQGETQINIVKDQAEVNTEVIASGIENLGTQTVSPTVDIKSPEGKPASESLEAIKVQAESISEVNSVVTITVNSEEFDAIYEKLQTVAQGMTIEISVLMKEMSDFNEFIDIITLLNNQDLSYDVEIKTTGTDKLSAVVILLQSLEDKVVNVLVNLGNSITDLQNAIRYVEDLVKYNGKVIDITVKKTIEESTSSSGSKPPQSSTESSVEGFADGGSIFKRMTKRFITQGSGLKDDVPILAKKNEYVHTDKAVDYYGVDIMDDLNAMRIPKEIFNKVRQFSNGGLVNFVAPFIQKFAGGGSVLSGSFGKMKKKLEDDLVSTRSGFASNFTLNLNNQFKNSGAATPTGMNAISSLKNIVSGAIANFATGGSTSVGTTSISSLQSEMNAQYKKDLDYANLTGNAKLAAILQKERQDINALTTKLSEDLKKLQADYDEYKSTRTLEHNEKIAEIEATFSKDDGDLESAHAEELDDLKKTYESKINDLSESESESDYSYKEALESYKKDKADLKASYEEEKKQADLEYMLARKEANALGASISSVYGRKKVQDEIMLRTKSDNEKSKATGPGFSNWLADDRAHAGSFTIDEVLRQMESSKGPYSIKGNSNPDFELMKRMIYEIWPQLETGSIAGEVANMVSQYLDNDTKVLLSGTTSLEGNLNKKQKEQQKAGKKIKTSETGSNLMSSGEGSGQTMTGSYKFVDSNYGAEQLSNIFSLESTLKSLSPESRKKEFDDSMAELLKNESLDTTEYLKDKKKIADERLEAELSYKESEADKLAAYEESKLSFKTRYDEDYASENTSFDEDIKNADLNLSDSTKSLKDSATSNYASIKDAAKSEYENEQKRILEEKKKLEEAAAAELAKVTQNVGKTTSETSSSSTSKSATDELAKVAQKFGSSMSFFTNAFKNPLPDDFWKKLGKGVFRFNSGGFVNPTSYSIPGKDSILASLTPKEYVIPENVVNHFGVGFFDDLRNFKIRGFNLGGSVGSLPSSSLNGDNSSVRHIVDLSFNGNHLGELQGQASTIDGFLDALSMAKRRA